MNESNLTPIGEAIGQAIPGLSDFPQSILVVEEEGDLRQLNGEVLIDAGYDVNVAEDGVTAWTALQLCHYDLLITNQFLPKVSGVQLLKKIHTARLTLPVIMITEILPTWEFALHPCLQAVTMLRKPYTIGKLLGMVKAALPQEIAEFADNVPAQSWQRPPAPNRLRL